MKKLLIVSSVICSVFYSAQAQIAKGSFMLGGGLSVMESKTEYCDEETKESTLSFGPSAGIFVADGILVGLNLGITKSESTDIENFDGDLYEYKL